MTLKQLEELTRPNFLWDKTAGRYWNVINPSGLTNTETTIGIVTFIGVAHMTGFIDRDIICHIGINRQSFDRHLNSFKKAYEMDDAAEKNTFFSKEAEPSNRIMIKTRLILNAISLAYNKKPAIKLSDLGY